MYKRNNNEDIKQIMKYKSDYVIKLTKYTNIQLF